MWDPNEILRRMPAAVWEVWERFYRKNPFGPSWDAFRAALGPWAAVNFHPFRKADAPPVPIEAFTPDLTKAQAGGDAPAAAASAITALAASSGADVIDLSRPID